MPDDDFIDLFHQIRAAVAKGVCVCCRQRFSDDNTHTEAGWGETQISGMCEDCFDAACAEPDEEGDQPT